MVDSEENKEWSNGKCSGVFFISVFLIDLVILYGQWHYALVASTLSVGCYFYLIKIFGSGSVVEMAVMGVVLNLLFSMLAPAIGDAWNQAKIQADQELDTVLLNNDNEISH